MASVIERGRPRLPAPAPSPADAPVSATSESAQPAVLPGRECGGCNVCCVALTIDDPQLQKAQGVRCPHNRADNLCGVYETRPVTCREFQCGWKVLKWAAPSMRPDRSGVLLRPRRGADGGPSGVVAIMLRREGLTAPGVAEALAAGIAGSVPIHLAVPGAPGQPSAVAPLNEELAAEVAAHDKAGFLRKLRRLYFSLAKVQRDPAATG